MYFFEPTTPDSSIARQLKESGPRVAHVAWGVDGIDQVFDKLRANGNRLSGENLVLVRSTKHCHKRFSSNSFSARRRRRILKIV